MSRYTSAYSSFKDRLAEVEILRKAAAAKERSDAIRYRNEINALCRGAIVLLCSHVEAFVKEIGELALDKFFANRVDRRKIPLSIFYHISKDIIDIIGDGRDAEKTAERIFGFLQSDGHFWSKNGSFPTQIPSDRFNKGFSNPGFRKIRAYFLRFGYSEYKNDLNVVLGPKSIPVINMLNHLVDTRNSIAHGDPSATKTPNEIGEMVKLISIFCRATDDVFASWCRKQFCAIR